MLSNDQIISLLIIFASFIVAMTLNYWLFFRKKHRYDELNDEHHSPWKVIFQPIKSGELEEND